MVFPESPRVIYKKNTLAEVICQVRFPAILRIDSEVPAEFQDRVRHSFPLLNEQQSPPIPELQKGIRGLIFPEMASLKAYDFLTDDASWTIGLTKNFLALSTNSYKEWRGFEDRFALPLDALIGIYKPAFFTRVGLRYRNVIKREEFKLETEDWNVVLSQWILGEMADPQVKASIVETTKEIEFDLAEDGRVRVRHGLANGADGSQAYVIDADFYIEKKTEVANVLRHLKSFNQESGRLFRWCITNGFHIAMEPIDPTNNVESA